MQRQLALLETEIDWKLDERTKAIGRRGIKQARAALREARAARYEAQLTAEPVRVPDTEPRPQAA